MKPLLATLGLLLFAGLAFGQRLDVYSTLYTYGPAWRLHVWQKGEAAQIAAASKAYDSAKAAYLKNPKNPQLRTAYIKATMNLADLNMNAQILNRKVRYENALHYYREVLKVDPNNKQAKQNRDMIVSIYKSLGKPVPPG